MLLEYESEYFGSKCGALQAAKTETTEKNKKRKLSKIWQTLKWIVDDSGCSEISEIVGKLGSLGRNTDGYYAINPKLSSHKDMGCIRELLRYLANQNRITQSEFMKADDQLKALSTNLRVSIGPNQAKKQAEEKSYMVSVQDLDNFYESTQVKEVKQLIASKPELSEVTIAQVAQVRNYIVTNMILQNSIRPCALYKLSVTQVVSAKVSEKTSLYEIPLYFDKTGN